MISSVRRLKDAPSEAKCQRIAEMLDKDHDGALDLVDVATVSNDKIVITYCLQFCAPSIKFGEKNQKLL